MKILLLLLFSLSAQAQISQTSPPGTLTFSEGATTPNGGVMPAVVKVVAGSDGSSVQVLRTNSNGDLQVGLSSAVGITNSLATIITNTANTAANTASIITNTASIITNTASTVTNTAATSVKLDLVNNSLATLIANSVPTNATGASGTVSTAITLSAPANAVGFILMNLDTSTTNIRWAIGGSATTTVGQQLQPGRSSDFVPGTNNVSVIAESGTCNYDIRWLVK